MFSRRDMLAATAAGGLVTAATMATTKADATTPVKVILPSAIRTIRRKAQSTPRIQGASSIPVRRIRPSGTSSPTHFPRRRPTSAACR